MEYEILANGQVLQIERIGEGENQTVIKTAFDMAYHLVLTADKPQIAADGADTATITATLFNHLGVQQTTNNVPITFTFDGQTIVDNTINGAASITFASFESGQHKISAIADRTRGGEISIEAVTA